MSAIRRRRLLRAGGALLVLAAVSSCAGPEVLAPRIRRVGALNVQVHLRDHVLAGLREFGYDGTRVSVDWRHSEHDLEESVYPIAADLVAAPVDVIVANGTAAQQAARRATSTIPIVTVTGTDPVGGGLVETLGRPGGNVTGVGIGAEGDADSKRVELLKEAFPHVSRVAIVSDDTPTRRIRRKTTEDAARSLGLEVLTVEVHEAKDLPEALGSAVRSGGDAIVQIYVAGSCDGAAYTIRFAAARRMPAAYGSTVCTDAGGLLSLGVDAVGQFRLAGNYVARILNGESPAEMPIEQPTAFSLVVNLRTARELGLTIPQSVLARATRVIE